MTKAGRSTGREKSRDPANFLAAMKTSFQFIDLFAGLGGFHVGLARAGGKCVFACEIDDGLQSLYAKNFGIFPAADIRAVSASAVPAHDIAVAGFPCQPFSKAGEQLGTECELAGDLFGKHLLRIISYRRPAFFMLENVPNLARHNGGETYQQMRAALEALGYTVDQCLLSPHRFGIPQIRERLFIVGSRTGLAHFQWPSPVDDELRIDSVLDGSPDCARPLPQQYVDCLNVWQEFLDLYPKDEELPSFPIWSMEFGADYPFEDSVPATLTPRQLCQYRGTHGVRLRDYEPKARIDHVPTYALQIAFPEWKQRFIRQNRDLYKRNKKWIRPWMKKLAPFPTSLQKFEWNCQGFERSVWKTVVQFRASGVRVKRPTTAPALVAMTTTQVPIISWQRRYMTVRECARLQDLDMAHLPAASTRAYKALGNAVNARLVELVAMSLLGPLLAKTNGSAARPNRGTKQCDERVVA